MFLRRLSFTNNSSPSKDDKTDGERNAVAKSESEGVEPAKDDKDDFKNNFEYEDKVVEIFLKRKMELVSAMKDTKGKGIEIKDRSWRLQTYHNCFIASELVTWLVSNFSSVINTRPLAVRLCEALQREGVFGHVVRQHLFKDDHLYFRFVDADVEALESALCSNPDLLSQMKDATNGGVHVYDKRIGFKTFKKCFSGKDLVDWLVNKSISLSRDKATRFGNALLIRRVLDHVTQEQYLEDSPQQFYVFLSDDQSLIFPSNAATLPAENPPQELTKQSVEKEIREKLTTPKKSPSFSSPVKSPMNEKRGLFSILDRLKKTEQDFKDGLYDQLGSDGLFHYILRFLAPKDFVTCCLLAHKYRINSYKYTQSYSTYYFNRRAFDIQLSLSTFDRFAVWHGVLNNLDGIYEKHLAQFKQFIYKGGIPPKLRGRVWQELLETASFKRKNPGLYEFCVQKSNESEYAIEKDIGRTFPAHPDFRTPNSPGQIKLFKVLKAFANFNHEIDYCQGMNFIVGVLVLHMTEEEAFWCLVCLMKYQYFEHIYCKGLPGLMHLLSVFDKLVEQQLPLIGATFKDASVTANTFANKWFLTLFGCVLPLPTVLRIWDMFVCDGWEIIMRLGLAILKHSEQYLAKAGFEDIFVYFDSLPPEVTAMDRLFSTALEFNLDTSMFADLR